MAVALGAVLQVGCGGGDKPPPPPGGGRDGGRDARGPDGALPDGGSPDATRPDAGGGDGGSPGECVHDPAGDRFEVGVDLLGRETRVALVPEGDGVLALWAGVGADGQALVRSVFLGPGGYPGLVGFVSDGTGTARSPAGAPLTSGVLATWVDAAPGSFELLSARLVGGTPMGSRVRLTNNMLLESDPAMTPFGGGAAVAWVEGDPIGDAQALKLGVLEGTGSWRAGSPLDVATGAAPPTRPALATRGDGLLLAWVDGGLGDDRHVWLQPLDMDGTADGSPVQLDTEGVPVGNVAIGWSGVGGIAVYDVDLGGATEVRYRLLDGTTAAPSATVSGAAEVTDTALGPGVAAFRGGWAIAYRVQRGGDVERTAIEVALVDGVGTLLERLDLGESTFVGGPVSVAVGSRGDLFVAYMEQNASGGHTARLARVRCSGGTTAPPRDGGVEGGTDGGSDGGVVGPPPDASVCLDDAGRPDLCACPVMRPCSGSSDCPEGSVCRSDGCGGQRCIPAGRRCGSPGDCGPASTCRTYDLGFTLCEPSGSGCHDSRDCPLGFACESGSCVDRRIGCIVGGDDCPVGFQCIGIGSLGAAFCAPLHVPCATDEACMAGARCVDLQGDGRKVCAFVGACRTDADCTADPSRPFCTSLSSGIAQCGPIGFCTTDGECPDGYVCRDLWGDGLSMCVPSGGSCSSTADCPPGQLCASVDPATPPRCTGTPVGS